MQNHPPTTEGRGGDINARVKEYTIGFLFKKSGEHAGSGWVMSSTCDTGICWPSRHQNDKGVTPEPYCIHEQSGQVVAACASQPESRRQSQCTRCIARCAKASEGTPSIIERIQEGATCVNRTRVSDSSGRWVPVGNPNLRSFVAV